MLIRVNSNQDIDLKQETSAPAAKYQEDIMSKFTKVLPLAFVVIYALTAAFPAAAAPAEKVIPTFSIANVVPNSSVTIRTYNLPASDVFEVLMGYQGTEAIGGIRVATFSTGSGGTLNLTFTIPASLRGLDQIAIRLQSVSGSGYYAFNWFPNGSFGHGGTYPYPVVVNHPYIYIDSVVRDATVTLTAYNLPPNDSFNVLMNYMGTFGCYGPVVGSFNTGSGGSQTFTYNIPAYLYHQYQIAIRIQSTSGSRYFAYNWFFNNTAY
jgi:hypothetical protein